MKTMEMNNGPNTSSPFRLVFRLGAYNIFRCMSTHVKRCSAHLPRGYQQHNAAHVVGSYLYIASLSDLVRLS